jgi:hypothetical protein
MSKSRIVVLIILKKTHRNDLTLKLFLNQQMLVLGTILISIAMKLNVLKKYI